MKIPVKFKKLHPEAKIPKQSTELATGYDLFATSEKLEANGVVTYGTGLAIEIPKNYTAYLVPRSSIANTSLMLNNSLGVIDADYRGELLLKFRNVTMQGAKKYNVGDKIGQLILLPRFEIDFEEVEQLTETQRGTGGWGSTGN